MKSNSEEWCFWEGDKKYPVCGRWSLRDCQPALEAVAERRGYFLCGCRRDVDLKLFPYLMPNRKYGMRRYRITDPHLEGCFATTLEAIFDPEPREGKIIYSEGIFDDRAEFEGPEPEGGGGGGPPRHGRPSYGDFTHLFQFQFNRASVEAFGAVNSGKAFVETNLVNPSHRRVFDRLAEIMDEPLLGRGRISPAARLRELGLKLLWGLTAQPIVSEAEKALANNESLKFQIARHWDCNTYRPTGPVVLISPKVLGNATGKVRAMLHPIGPPYLFAILAKPETDGSCRAIKLFRTPMAVVERSVFSVESEAERRSLEVLCGIALLKPHVHCDLRALGGDLWPFPTTQDGRLPCRPDVIAFIGGRVVILYLTHMRKPKDNRFGEEITGELPNKMNNKSYHEDLNMDIERMNAFINCPFVFVKAIDVQSLIDIGAPVSVEHLLAAAAQKVE
jgi:hypothetical protein